MKMKEKQYNSILDIKEGIICHQVNCQNVMGAGIARAIYEKYPRVKTAYHKRCELYPTQKERSDALYGHYQLVNATNTLIVANIFSQDKFGNGIKRGICFTNTRYLVNAIADIAKTNPDKIVYIPEKIGCGYGGGNWEEIKDFIVRLPYNNIQIINSPEIQKERNEQIMERE